MSYEKHTWVNNETITAAKMNNIEDGIEEAAQSGGYDLVIVYNSRPSTPTWTIASGDILECEDKMDAGEIVNGLLVVLGSFSFMPSGANTQNYARYVPLTAFIAPYTLLKFGAIEPESSTSIRWTTADVTYDPDTGEILNAGINQKII